MVGNDVKRITIAKGATNILVVIEIAEMIA